MYINFNRRGVRVGIGLIGGVCVSLPLIKCSAVRAAAADLDSYTLSPSQAVALYGSSLEANYYNGDTFEKVDFNYIGSTFDLTSLSGYPSDGTPTYCAGFLAQDQSTGFMNREYFENTPFLIYRWEVSEIVSAANVDFSIQLNFSLPIECFGYQTSIFWSRSLTSVFPGVNAGLSYYASSYTLFGNSVLDVLTVGQYLARPNVGSEYGIIRTMPTNCMYLEDHSNPPTLSIFNAKFCTTFLGMTAFTGSRETGSDYVTVGSSQINIKLERPVRCPKVYDPAYDSVISVADDAVYLLIQCPTLFGDYVLPSGDGASVDLSQIEEYLAQQTEDISNISEEATVQTRQLIAILAKLEQIYQKIPSVDLSVPTLSTAPSIPIDSEIDSRISADLESYEMPDIDESLDLEKISSFSEFIMSYTRIIPVEVIGASAFLLFFSFVMWIIFRGRGS